MTPPKTITISNSGSTFSVPPAVPKVATVAQRNAWLSEHNTRRASSHQVTWVSQLAHSSANYAAHLANQPGCALVHSSGVGENLAVGQDNLAEVLEDWWDDEKPCYDASRKRCKSGCVCGHYTQAAWYASAQIGCAQATCSQAASEHFNHDVFVCHYVRPGNCNDYDLTQTNSSCSPMKASSVDPNNWPN
jgi:Cysteine-rich secretory protein family